LFEPENEVVEEATLEAAEEFKWVKFACQLRL
jgi:hypothetical protein